MGGAAVGEGNERLGRVWIYGVLDPRSGALVYVGQTTVSVEARLRRHLMGRGEADYAEAPFYAWVRAVCDERGERPVAVTREEGAPEVAVTREEGAPEVAASRERFW